MTGHVEVLGGDRESRMLRIISVENKANKKGRKMMKKRIIINRIKE